MKIIKTSAPLSIDLIKQYFQDKELSFEVSYKDSKLKDKVFLTYLSNLDIPSDVSLTDSTEEEIAKLLLAFMTAKSVLTSYTLTMMCVQILLHANNIDVSQTLTNPLLSTEFVEKFITDNKEEVLAWVTFINSSMVFLINSFSELQPHLNIFDEFEKIDDPDYVGLNVVNVFQIPGFLETFLSNGPTTKMYYFINQFEGHIFKGKSFFEYYHNGMNIFDPLLSALIDQTIPLTPEEMFSVPPSEI
jgi:hypothetical protein